MLFSANDDPELRDWLRWATESGEASSFIRTVAEAGFIADLEDYALLRPVLLQLRGRGSFMPTSNSQESRCEQMSPEDGALTPELKGFIERTIVPLLVDRYMEKMKDEAQQQTEMPMPKATPPPEQ